MYPGTSHTSIRINQVQNQIFNGINIFEKCEDQLGDTLFFRVSITDRL